MRFEVIPSGRRAPNEGADVAYLLTDNWNDWFRYQTQYYLTCFDAMGQQHDIGEVKIGQFGMEKGRPTIPDNFERLSGEFFSLGQDTEYYLAIAKLDQDLAMELLSALNDIAADDELYRRALEENVTGVSLLRYVSTTSVEGQFRRILSGHAPLTPYEFVYVTPSAMGFNSIELAFQVEPDSKPPTNIHVVIGRNGVGKSFTLNAMTRALIASQSAQETDGSFLNDGREPVPFASLLSISFSAFDDFKQIRQIRDKTEAIRYVNVGLRKRVKKENGETAIITLSPDVLKQEFAESAKACVVGAKVRRWRAALISLESDPLFAEAAVASLAEEEEENFGRAARALYKRLSSGHKIVLLTITKLVEHTEERTLVLMDEPEAHLHPPLLSALIRALSDLLLDRNAVAIIATHSPVVLQEVPRSCVWKIFRHGQEVAAERPAIETFAQNIGVLTREVFGLELTRSGFHRLLFEAAEGERDLDAVTEKFDNEVGSDGRALINSIIASRDNGARG